MDAADRRLLVALQLALLAALDTSNRWFDIGWTAVNEEGGGLR
jgi:hypothetical protein